MSLAIIKSAEENAKAYSACGHSICWIGLAEAPGTESWGWHDGSEVSYSNWHTGQPDNFGGRDEDRAVMNFDWGVLAKQAVASWKCDGRSLDATWFDAPGSEKIAYPLCQSSTGAFVKMNSIVDYKSAMNSCVEKSMSLATIKSAEENEKAFSACGQSICWIGLVEAPGTESWQWHDGSKVSYSNWHTGEPNNFGGRDENRAIMNFDWDVLAKQKHAVTSSKFDVGSDETHLVREMITKTEVLPEQPGFSKTGSSTSGTNSTVTVVAVAVALTSLLCCVLTCCMAKALCGCLFGGVEDVFDGDGKVGLTGQAEEMGLAGMAGHYLA